MHASPSSIFICIPSGKELQRRFMLQQSCTMKKSRTKFYFYSFELLVWPTVPDASGLAQESWARSGALENKDNASMGSLTQPTDT